MAFPKPLRILKTSVIRLLQDAIDRAKSGNSGAATWAAPISILLFICVVWLMGLIFELVPYNRGLQRLMGASATILTLMVFSLLYFPTYFLPRPQAWARWTVWILTVIGLQTAIFGAALALGWTNRRAEAAGLTWQLLGWGLIALAALCVILLLVDLWRQKRMTEVISTAKR